MIYKETSQPNQKEQFTAVMRKQLTCWDCISLKCKHITNNINERIWTFVSHLLKLIHVCTVQLTTPLRTNKKAINFATFYMQLSK